MARVSVIIPTYNREKYVTRAIESVLRQNFKDYEIIVVDDGSEDNTQEHLGRYKDKIKYVYQDNAGVGAARNTGIKFTSGEWLAFLDSDDEWKPDYLSRQIERVDESPGICMQTTDCLFIGLNGERRRYFEINKSLPEFKKDEYLILDEPFRFVVTHMPWPMVSTIIRREALIKAGLFDTSFSLSEDFELMARVSLQGHFGLIKEELVNVYRRDESITALTIQARNNPIGAIKANGGVFEKLRNIEGLKYDEIRTLNKLLSSERRSMGNLLIENGKSKEARNYFRDALFISPSMASFCKYVLSYLPASTNLWIIEKTLNLKSKKKVR